MENGLTEIIDNLKQYEDKGLVFIRKQLEKLEELQIKQGKFVEITKKLSIDCCHCGVKNFEHAEAYVDHLVTTHRYSREEALMTAAQPQIHHEMAIHQLSTLLTEFTDFYVRY